MKCYTAEEIGDAVGLSVKEIIRQVSDISEDILKSHKVQFSDDYQPPVYNIWTQQKIADAVGCDKGYVSRVLTNKLQCNKTVNIPDHIKTRPHQADFRKLPAELRENIARRHLYTVAKCVFGEAWADYEKAKAKERRESTQAKPGEGKVGERKISLTDPKGKSRDAIGARVGVSDPGRLRKSEGEGATRNAN